MEKRRGGGGEGEAGWLGTKGGWLKVGGGRFQNIFWAQSLNIKPKYILDASFHEDRSMIGSPSENLELLLSFSGPSFIQPSSFPPTSPAQAKTSFQMSM